ncbi:MAG: hypothetical protein ACYTFK_11610 [Planctomycetota bacterium]
MVATNKGPTKSKKRVLNAKPHGKSCSFCNKHQRNVPLMVRSPVTNSCICAFCAMGITTQSMDHMVAVSSAFSQVVENKPEWFDQNPETGAISFVDPEKELSKIVDTSNGRG